MAEAHIRIREITAADAETCGRIVYDAFCGIADKHNFPHDFPSVDHTMGLVNAMIANPRVVGVVAEVDGKIIGSNFIDLRDAIGGVGPITVDPTNQCKGVGRRLMQAVLERGHSAAGIRLVQDAFNTVSMSLYTSVGFDAKEPLALMRGKPGGKASTAGEARPMQESDIPFCGELCRRVHGWDRIGELRDSIKMFRPFVLVRGGRVVAYASAPTFWVLNHGVAETEQDMADLLTGAAAANPEPLSLLVPIRRANFFRWCLSAGLRVLKPMTLMAMGQYNEPRGAFFPSVVY